MEEDLKVLEKFINRCKECKFATCEQCEINWTQIKSIENLINRNKELEEKANKLGKLYYEVNENCIKYEKDYIPKSKVREKIEELKEEYIQLFELERKDGERETDCKIVIGEMEILEKLLQEGDK